MHVNSRLRAALVLVLVLAGTLTATGAWADTTLHIHFTLVNGDTVSRANYYTGKRMRATAPDGREYIFISKGKRVTVIDHPTKTYWEGSLATADSIVDSLNAMRYREVMSRVTEEQKATWPGIIQSINESIRVDKAWEQRKIAGYSCARWTVSAGSWMTNDRWVAAALLLPNYSPDFQRVLLASVANPLAKAYAKMVISATEIDGLVLASSATFRTPSTSGSYSWETYEIESTKIPDSVWKVPPDYRRMTWSDVQKARAH
jgi:hypothetical protein